VVLITPDYRRDFEAALAAVRAEISTEVTSIDSTLALVETILTAGAIRFRNPRGLNSAVLDIVLALLAKGCKTTRAIRAVALEGAVEDVMVLLRSLYETALAVQWLLQRDTRRRAMLYVAHSEYRYLVQLREMANAAGQKRAVKASEIAEREALVAEYERVLGKDAVARVRKHWGGGLEGVAKSLGLRVWRRLYNSLYRFTSHHAHAGDAQLHYHYRHDRGTQPRQVLGLLPSAGGLSHVLPTAEWLLLMSAKRVNDRLGMDREDEFNSALVKVNARMGEIK